MLKRRPVEVLFTFNANASRMAISSITLAELLHGAEKSSRVSENLAAIEDFYSRLEVLPFPRVPLTTCSRPTSPTRRHPRPISFRRTTTPWPRETS